MDWSDRSVVGPLRGRPPAPAGRRAWILQPVPPACARAAVDSPSCVPPTRVAAALSTPASAVRPVRRYSTSLSHVFSRQHKLELEWRVELALLKALGEVGRIPVEAHDEIKKIVDCACRGGRGVVVRRGLAERADGVARAPDTRPRILRLSPHATNPA